jgi:hypothetical protein
MHILKSMMLTAAIVAAIALGGCTTHPEPFDYEPDNELKKGPGLFSGEDGAFTIYRKPMESEASDPTQSGKDRATGEAPPSGSQ